MGVVGVVDNKRAPKTITVLGRQMAVVPESPYVRPGLRIEPIGISHRPRTSLGGGIELVQEGVSGGDGALVDERRPVSPVGPLLEEPVPVLEDYGGKYESPEQCDNVLTMLVDFNIVWLVNWSMTFNWKVSPYR